MKDKQEIAPMEIMEVEKTPEKSSDTMMGLIEKIALMPDSVATGNLERLHEMHKEMQDREAEVLFNKSFVAAQAEMPIVIKDANNDQTKSKYAKLQTITKMIKPIYTANGFGMIGGMAESPLEKHIRVTINLIHSGGHSKAYFHDMPIDDKGIKGSANKTQPHAIGSSTTYATRYLKCLIWDVQIAEDDDGNQGPKQKSDNVVISADQLTDIKDKLKEKSIDKDVILRTYDKKDLWALTYGDYKNAIDRLNQTK